MLIPTVIEQSGNSERGFDIFSRMLRDRVVFCNGQVTQELANVVVAQLLYLESESSTKDVTLVVAGPGGSIDAGMQIVDTMNFISCDVSTHAMGMVASMSSFIAASGAKGKRYIMPNTRHMIHQPLGGAEGQATDIAITAKEILRIKENMNRLYAQYTNQPYDTICQDTERDFYMSAQQSVEYGLADQIISKRGQQ